MRIRSFGCSFIFGTVLKDDGRNEPRARASQLTWPALLAQRLGVDYACDARGGSGNLHIADKVMMRATQERSDEIFIVQWSYIDRFDWIDPLAHERHYKDHSGWTGILPGNRDREGEFYYRHIHTQLFDQYRSLIQAAATVDLLVRRKQRFLMCYVDPLMFERRFPLPNTLTALQEHLWPHMLDFETHDFVHWSRLQGFPISGTGHPLEQAHQAAADLMWPHLERLL